MKSSREYSDRFTGKTNYLSSSGWPWLLLSFVLIVMVGLYDYSLDPIVHSLGLAHSSVFSQDSKQILVADNISSGDAHLVQQFFRGEIWGRHSFRVYLMLAPFFMLVIAFAILCRDLARRSTTWGKQLFRIDSGLELPNFPLWLAFFMGGCAATVGRECGVQVEGLAFAPLGLAVAIAGLLSSFSGLRAGVLAKTIEAVAAARWFGFGCLVFLPGKLFYEEATGLGIYSGLYNVSFLSLIFSLMAIYFVSTIALNPDYSRFGGDTTKLKQASERYCQLSLQELLFLLPVAFLASVIGQLRVDMWAIYFMIIAASVLAVRFSVDRAPDRWYWQGLRLVFKLVVLSGGIYVLVYYRKFMGLELTALLSFSLVLLGIAIAGGISWYTARQGIVRDKRFYFKLFFPAALLIPTILFIIAFLTPSILMNRGLSPQVASSAINLQREVGYRARLFEHENRVLLVGCQLDLGARNPALVELSSKLGKKSVVSIAVPTTKWERWAKIVLAVTVAVSLALPAYLLTFARPGAVNVICRAPCVILGGLNGGIAFAASLGWFWLDPLPYLMAFGLSVGLDWLGSGVARSWLDRRLGLG